MQSNKDLKSAIEAEAAKTGVEMPDLEDKKNSDLVTILDGLKNPVPPPPADTDSGDGTDAEAKAKEVADAKAKVKADAKAKVKAEAAKAKEVADAAKAALPPYSVALGKSITTKRGILADGVEIKVSDLAGGQDAIDNLVLKNYVNKND